MRWLKRKLREWLIDFNDNEVQKNPTIGYSSRASRHRDDDINIRSNGTEITFYAGNGGYVLETRCFDLESDRSNVQLYVIPDDRNLGEELAKILTMEALKR